MMVEFEITNTTAYIAEFANFNEYLLAFLTNLSGNTFNIFIFFNDISVAMETCNLNEVYYTIGKIVNALLEVQPLPPYDVDNILRSSAPPSLKSSQ